jgi:hypothetical protein
MVGDYPGLKPWRSETLRDIWEETSFWVGPEMEKYIDNEENLPFDTHFLKALIAPRVLFVSEAAADIWANPVGSWQTSLAAREVYRFLGKEENLVHTFRPGYHEHQPRDLQVLVDVMKAKIAGHPLCENNFRLPFPEQKLIFDWRCPV